MCSTYWLHKWKIYNAQMYKAKDNDRVMLMYNLIEYSDNYSKTSGSLWQYYRDETFLDVNSAISDFPADDNNRALSKFKNR